MYSVSQVIFFLLFLGSLFLLLIFGETTFGIVFLGLIVTLCVMASRHIKLELAKTFAWPLVLLGVFVLTVFLSLLTTISVPLTVNAAMFYGASYSVFFFLLTCDPKWLPTRLILIGSSILIVIFALLTILYTLFPSLAVSLPSVTLLTAQYGHNQASILFLLVLPVLWHFADKHHSHFAKVAVVFVCSALLLSFARVASILTVAELMFLMRGTTDAVLKTIGKVLFGVVAMAVLVIGVLSVSGDQSTSCVIPFFQSKLCKSIHTELRPAYWSQATRAAMERPFTGWGGGTFSLLSPVYQEKYGDFSGYAHNEVLQAFAEYGFFGGVSFGAFLLWLLVKAVRVLKKSEQGLLSSLALATLCVIITSFFDFGWHMIGIWLCFLLFVAHWLRTGEDLSTKRNKRSSVVSTVVTPLSLLVVVMSTITVMVWSFAFVISGMYWRQGNKDLSIKVFPFAYWRVEDVLQNETDSDAQSYIFSLYQNHYRVWDAAARSEFTPASLKASYLSKAIKLDPFTQQRYLLYVKAALMSKDPDIAVAALQTWREKKQENTIDMYSYSDHGEVAKMAITEANDLMIRGKLLQAIRIYEYAYQIQAEQFSMNDVLIFEKMKEISFSEMENFLGMLEYSKVFPHEQKIYEGGVYHLRSALRKGNADEAEKVMKIMLPLQDKWLLAKEIEQEWSDLKQPNELVRAAFSKAVSTWEKYTQVQFNYGFRQQIGMNDVENR